MLSDARALMARNRLHLSRAALTITLRSSPTCRTSFPNARHTCCLPTLPAAHLPFALWNVTAGVCFPLPHRAPRETREPVDRVSCPEEAMPRDANHPAPPLTGHALRNAHLR